MNSNTCSQYESANAYLDHLGDRAEMISEAWECIERRFEALSETKEFKLLANELKSYYSRFNDENVGGDLCELFQQFGALR